jgi:hypothetical protein
MDAQVQLAILRAHEVFIEEAILLERLARPAAEIHGIDRTFVKRPMRLAAAGNDNRRERQRDGLGNVPRPDRDPGSSHVIGTGGVERAKTLEDVCWTVY